MTKTDGEPAPSQGVLDTLYRAEYDAMVRLAFTAATVRSHLRRGLVALRKELDS